VESTFTGVMGLILHKPMHWFAVGLLCGALLVGVGSWQWQRSNTPVILEDKLSPSQHSTEIATPEIKDSLSGEIVVHIAGAVVDPGLLSLPAASRLGEAIEKAGGALVEANLDQLNLAIVVQDGERYYIPTTKEQQEQTAIGKSEQVRYDGKLDLNLAKLSDLMELPQIGESRAKAILEYREKQGRFHSADEIMKVPGIGEGIYAVIQDQITVR